MTALNGLIANIYDNMLGDVHEAQGEPVNFCKDDETPMEPLALTLLEAVVESVAFFSQPGIVVTFEAVIDRLRNTHGIDNIERNGRVSDCVALINEGVEVGVIVKGQDIRLATTSVALTFEGRELAVERGWAIQTCLRCNDAVRDADVNEDGWCEDCVAIVREVAIAGIAQADDDKLGSLQVRWRNVQVGTFAATAGQRRLRFVVGQGTRTAVLKLVRDRWTRCYHKADDFALLTTSNTAEQGWLRSADHKAMPKAPGEYPEVDAVGFAALLTDEQRTEWFDSIVADETEPIETPIREEQLAAEVDEQNSTSALTQISDLAVERICSLEKRIKEQEACIRQQGNRIARLESLLMTFGSAVDSQL